MTGRINDQDIAAVRARTRIDEVIREHVTLKPAGGGSLKGLCPFHDERSPSFHVTPAKGFYHCFGCQAGGDAITFLMQLEGLSFAEAVEKLAARTGIALRYEEGGSSVERDVGKRGRLTRANAIAAAFFREQLASPRGRQARTILAERGFDQAAVEQFGVGFAPGGWDNLTKHLTTNRVEVADQLAAGLVADGRRGVYDRFRNRLIWPIEDLSGDVVGFGARRIDDTEDSPKYLNTPETAIYKKSQVLYGLNRARKSIAKSQQAVIVEGYTDVMAAHLAGLDNAVATCGTAFGDEHVTVLRRLLMDSDSISGQVVFTFDSDEAGRNAALKAFALDHRFVAHTFVAVDRSGLDPADLRLQQGDDAVRRLVDNRVPLFEFALRAAVEAVEVSTAEGRTDGLRATAPILAGIRESTLRREYERTVAGWLGLPVGTVAGAVRSAGRRTEPRAGSGGGGRSGGSRHLEHAQSPGQPGGSSRGAVKPLRRPQGGPALVEYLAMQALIQVPSAAQGWFDVLEPEALRTPELRRVYEVLLSVGPPPEGVSEVLWMQDLLGGCDEPTRQHISALTAEPLQAAEPDARYVRSLIARLLDRDALARMSSLQAALQRLGHDEDQARRDLLEQWNALNNVRRGLLPHLTGGGV